jgi:hypothetical protein
MNQARVRLGIVPTQIVRAVLVMVERALPEIRRIGVGESHGVPLGIGPVNLVAVYAEILSPLTIRELAARHNVFVRSRLWYGWRGGVSGITSSAERDS